MNARWIAVPPWIALLVHAYLIGVTEARRRAVLIGVGCFLGGLWLGLLAGCEMKGADGALPAPTAITQPAEKEPTA